MMRYCQARSQRGGPAPPFKVGGPPLQFPKIVFWAPPGGPPSRRNWGMAPQSLF